MKILISSANLGFTKPNCGCGIISSKQRKQFLASVKKKYKKNKKLTRHAKLTKHAK
jgi:hypothetical protein